MTDPTPTYPFRVVQALRSLDRNWQTFTEAFTCYTALESKQMTGTLVRMRNAGIVQSRRIHRDTGAEVVEWRLSSQMANLR